MAYCDYYFYTKKYLGNVIAEADFPRLIKRASKEFDYLTRDRLTVNVDGDIVRTECGVLVDEKMADDVKEACCRIAELIGEIELYEKSIRDSVGYSYDDGTLKGKVVTSISSGSESISYASGNSDAVKNSLVGAVLTNEMAQHRLFLNEIRKYVGKYHLLYAGL